MSELTQCNFCSLNWTKARAEREGKQVTILDGDFIEMGGGKDVFVHPPGVDIEALAKEEREKYWVSWKMIIPDHCCC